MLFKTTIEKDYESVGGQSQGQMWGPCELGNPKLNSGRIESGKISPLAFNFLKPLQSSLTFAINV